MNLQSILKKVGGAIIRDVVPGGGLVLDLVNSFLPEDKQLPTTATGDQARAAVEAMPPDQRAMLMAKELDVEIAEINSFAAIQESLARADAAGASTRPEIAKMMAQVVCFAVVVVVGSYAVAIWRDSGVVAKINDSWAVVLTVLATPTALLQSYFGLRTREKTSRYGVAAGQEPPPAGLAGMIGALFGRKS